MNGSPERGGAADTSQMNRTSVTGVRGGRRSGSVGAEGALPCGVLGGVSVLVSVAMAGCIFREVPVIDQYSTIGPQIDRPYDGHSAVGVELHNRSSTALLVELFEVDRDGAAQSIGRSVLAPEGEFTYKVPAEDFRNGRRVRIGLPDAQGRVNGDRVSGAVVELNLPSVRTRYYDLTVEAGRLMAREHPLGAHRRGPDEYNWGD